MIEVTTNATKVLAGLDLDLLDHQISRLHEMEEHEALNEAQQEAVTGLCEFLSLLHRALDVEPPAVGKPKHRLHRFQIDRYMRSGGVRCPFCGSDSLDSDRPSTTGDDGVFQATCRCGGCRGAWVDEYRLTGISGESFDIVEDTQIAPEIEVAASTSTYSRNTIELAVTIAHDFFLDERHRQFRERHGKRLGGFVGTVDWLIDCAAAFDQAESAEEGRPGEDWDWILAVERYVSDLYERHLDEDRNPRSDDDELRRRLAADAIAAARQ